MTFERIKKRWKAGKKEEEIPPRYRLAVWGTTRARLGEGWGHSDSGGCFHLLLHQLSVRPAVRGLKESWTNGSGSESSLPAGVSDSG